MSQNIPVFDWGEISIRGSREDILSRKKPVVRKNAYNLPEKEHTQQCRDHQPETQNISILLITSRSTSAFDVIIFLERKYLSEL